MDAALMVADRGAKLKDSRIRGSHRDPEIWEEREKNSSRDRRARSTVSGLLAEWYKAIDSKGRGPGFESRRGQNLQSTVTEQLRGTGALGGKPSVPGINKWTQLLW